MEWKTQRAHTHTHTHTHTYTHPPQAFKHTSTIESLVGQIAGCNCDVRCGSNRTPQIASDVKAFFCCCFFFLLASDAKTP